jgi:glutaredoxin
MRPRALLVVTAITSLLSACRRSAPPAPPPVEASALPAIQVRATSKMLFTFVGEGGAFQTVNELAKVPEGSRGWVRVLDLAMKPEKRRDLELVYVADLRQARSDGAYPYVVMSRGAFESLALNRSRPGAAAPASQPAAATAGGAAGRVILYSTSWCPACRSARQYLTEKGIPFVEKDIEKDAGAAEELMQKARRQGISTSGVPVLEVNGTLLQGFDPDRLAELLPSK